MTIPRRAGIYARVSSHRQQRQATIESQVAELRARVLRDGHQLLDEHVLMDDGYSGSYLDRPGLDRLRDLLREHVLDVVYIHAPDRLARRYAHQAILMDEIQGRDCEIVFLNHAPSDDPEGQLLVQIQGVIAEYERAKICDRMRRGKLHHARQGAVVSWKAPYGYRYVPRQVDERGRWEIDENEAPIVRRLFGWIADEGISLREATKRLNGSSFKPRCGGDLWCTSSVRAIVTNDAYTGVSYYNRRRFVESDRTDGVFRKTRKTRCVFRPKEEWIPVPVPALIDEDTFRRAQERMKINKAFAPRNLKRAEEYLLRCLVSCGVCGRSMVAHACGCHTYYHCSASIDYVTSGRAQRCPSPMVYAPDLDRLVWDQISTLLRSPDLLRNAWVAQRQQGSLGSPNVVEVELKRVVSQIQHAEQQLRRLVDGYQQGILTSAELGSRRERLERQIVHHRDEQQRLLRERPKWQETQEVLKRLSLFCQHVASGLSQLAFQDRQALLRKVIERITVAGEEVTVKLAIPLSTNSPLTSLRVHDSTCPARAVPARAALARPARPRGS